VGLEGVAVVVEPPPLRAGHQDRQRTGRSRDIHVGGQMLLERGPRLGAPRRVLDLLVVVRELGDQHVTRADRLGDRLQSALVDEALGTAAVASLVRDGDPLGQVEGKRHAPARLGRGGQLLRGGCGIAGDVNDGSSPFAGSGFRGR
jgi:hypothetical protein